MEINIYRYRVLLGEWTAPYRSVAKSRVYNSLPVKCRKIFQCRVCGENDTDLHGGAHIWWMLSIQPVIMPQVTCVRWKRRKSVCGKGKMQWERIHWWKMLLYAWCRGYIFICVYICIYFMFFNAWPFLTNM